MIPVLEIGGTHVSAALVDPDAGRLAGGVRLGLSGDGSADELLDRFAAAARQIAAPSGAWWGVALPDPFDYERGLGRFAGVGKFGALDGVDVGRELRRRIDARAFTFLNDADAFVLGEWVAGAAAGTARCAGITLGTGVGSGWLVDGAIADPGDPPGGRIHRLSVGGRPLEDTVSRRALRRAFAAAGGDPGADVREICAAARTGDRTARQVLDTAFTALGRVIGACVAGFRAEVLVIGGSMAASWDVLETPVRAGAEGSGLPPVRLARHPEHAALIGAAVPVTRSG